MEEDIELVEEFINICEINFKFYEQPNVVIISDTVKSIKNLINRVKELEKLELEHQKINGNLREKIKELEQEHKRALSDLLIAENTKHTCPYIPTSGVTCKAKEFETKIKNKIEELDKEEQELQNTISDEEREEYSDASISWGLCDIETRRRVLQELIEE